MKTRYKILIIIIVLSSVSLFLYNFYFTENRGLVYPGGGMVAIGLETKLCEKLGANATFGNCFGINDICEDVYGILKYDKKRSEVGCSLHNRIDNNCTNIQLATGWVQYSEMFCFLPFEKEFIDSTINSRK